MASRKQSTAVNTENVQAALKYLSNLVSLTEITIGPTKTGAFLHGSDGVATATVMLKSNGIKLTDSFTLDANAFQKAISGRASVQITQKEGQLVIRGASYQASLAIGEANEINNPKSDAEEVSFSPELWVWLQGALRTLKIASVVGSEQLFLLDVNPKRVVAAVVDMIQICCMVSTSREILKGVKKGYQFFMNRDNVSRVFLSIPSADTRIAVEEGGYYLRTSIVRAFIPLGAPETDVTPRDILENVKVFSAPIKGGAEFDKDQLKLFLSNAGALGDKAERGVQMAPSKGGVDLKCETSDGKVVGRIEGSLKKPVNVDYRFLEVMSELAVSNTVNLDIQESSARFVTKQNDGTTLTYVCGLMS